MNTAHKYIEVLNWFTSAHRDEVTLKTPFQDDSSVYATNGNSHIIYLKTDQNNTNLDPKYPNSYPLEYPKMYRFIPGIKWSSAKPKYILKVQELLEFLNSVTPAIPEQYECQICMGDKFIRCKQCNCKTICLKCDKKGKTGFTGRIIPDPSYNIKINENVFRSTSIRKMIDVCMLFGIELIYILTDDKINRNIFSCGNMQIGLTPIQDKTHNKIIKIVFLKIDELI